MTFGDIFCPTITKDGILVADFYSGSVVYVHTLGYVESYRESKLYSSDMTRPEEVRGGTQGRVRGWDAGEEIGWNAGNSEGRSRV